LLCFGAGRFNFIVPFGLISFLGVTFTVLSSSEPADAAAGALDSAINPLAQPYISIAPTRPNNKETLQVAIPPSRDRSAHSHPGTEINTPFFVSAIIAHCQ
jgi:hypothetical protein